jgi:uncharacterized membrane protein YagU involved in acid resistance
MDDHHFGDITKFAHNRTIGPKVLIQDPTLHINFSFIYLFVYSVLAAKSSILHQDQL